MASEKYFQSKKALGLNESASDVEMSDAIAKLKGEDTPKVEAKPEAKTKKKR